MKTFHQFLVSCNVLALSVGGYYLTASYLTLQMEDKAVIGSLNTQEAKLIDASFQEEMVMMKKELKLLKTTLRQHSSQSSEGVLQQSLTSLKDEVRLLGDQLTGALNAIEALSQQTQTKQEALAQQPIDKEFSSLDDEYHHDEAIQVINTTFETEPVDGDWSFETTDLITQSLDIEQFPDTTMQNVECRSSLCRMEVAHADEESQRLFELEFPMLVAEQLPAMSFDQQQLDDGSFSSIIYMARSGFNMPSKN